MLAERCPVCSGKGIVPSNFYTLGNGGTSNTATPQTCRSCNGSGVVWPPKLAAIRKPLSRGVINFYGPMKEGAMPVDLSVTSVGVPSRGRR